MNESRVLVASSSVTSAYDPNTYMPVFMPEQTIYVIAAGGIQDWVASVPQCLAFESVDDLVSALKALGYTYTESFAAFPFSGGNAVFGGGPRNGLVPWIGMSPVPPVNGWQASQGAFAVNAGKYADFWNHGVHPFVGSSYQSALAQDIQMRMDAARAGKPDLG